MKYEGMVSEKGALREGWTTLYIMWHPISPPSLPPPPVPHPPAPSLHSLSLVNYPVSVELKPYDLLWQVAHGSPPPPSPSLHPLFFVSHMVSVEVSRMIVTAGVLGVGVGSLSGVSESNDHQCWVPCPWRWRTHWKSWASTRNTWTTTATATCSPRTTPPSLLSLLTRGLTLVVSPY